MRGSCANMLNVVVAEKVSLKEYVSGRGRRLPTPIFLHKPDCSILSTYPFSFSTKNLATSLQATLSLRAIQNGYVADEALAPISPEKENPETQGR